MEVNHKLKVMNGSKSNNDMHYVKVLVTYSSFQTDHSFTNSGFSCTLHPCPSNNLKRGRSQNDPKGCNVNNNESNSIFSTKASSCGEGGDDNSAQLLPRKSGKNDVSRRKQWKSHHETLTWGWPINPVIFTLILILSPVTNAHTNQSNRDSAWRRSRSTHPDGSVSLRDQHERAISQSDIYIWGPWSRVTACTRTCGLGIRYRRRVCYRTSGRMMELAENVNLCEGPERSYEICPEQAECPFANQDDWRYEQCAFYNPRPYRGRLHRWRPFERRPGHTALSAEMNTCALICCTEGHNERHHAVRFAPKVRDGTLCEYSLEDVHLGRGGICINGSCERVGCDGILYSDKELDRCNVCGGDNNTCRLRSGEVRREVPRGYTNVVTIPPEASHIRLAELEVTNAVFGVRNEDGILFVNGRSSESYPTIYRHVPGLTFRYYHSQYAPHGLERLEADGRSTQTLYIMIRQPEPGQVRVSYKYSVPLTFQEEIEESPPETTHRPTQRAPTSVHHSLSFEGPPSTTQQPMFIPEHGPSPWREAMRIYHNIEAHAVEEISRVPTSSESSLATTSDSYLPGNVTVTEDSFPEVGMPGESVPANAGSKYRNPQTSSSSYSYFWKIDAAAPCSATCTSGIQTTHARCYRNDNIAVENSFCEDAQRPKSINVRCQGRPCSPRWVASLWSSCSVSCGAGQQFRTVHCWRMLAPGFDSTVLDYLCSTLNKPFLVRSCEEVDCGPLWETSQWGECSRKCGSGIQTRNVRCSSATNPCHDSIKPTTSRRCTLGPCIHKWIVSEWGECSGRCKNGMRKRSVTCRDGDGEFLHDKYCDEHTRPLTVQACTTLDEGSCPPKWVPQDWGVCSVDCDWGETSRDVACGSVVNGSFRQMPERACRDARLPRRVTKCREPPCKARWHFTDWSQCSKSCGEGGVRVRKVACYRDNKHSRHCDITSKPSASDACINRPCQQEPDNDRGP